GGSGTCTATTPRHGCGSAARWRAAASRWPACAPCSAPATSPSSNASTRRPRPGWTRPRRWRARAATGAARPWRRRGWAGGRERGDYAGSAARHEQSLAAWRELGDERGAMRALNAVALAAWLQGRSAEASALAEQSLAAFRRMGDGEGTAWGLLNLAAAALHQ